MTTETDDELQVFDRAERDALRRDWLDLVDRCVWGGVQATRLGALPRLRKRVAELGERLAALDAARAWIPRRRERLKSALATALAAREALAQCGQALEDAALGAERDALRAALERIERRCAPRIAASTERWAQRLEALNTVEIED
jgi:hypothetical protein